MTYLTRVAEVASILGLVVSLCTLWRIRSLRQAIGKQSIQKELFALFDAVSQFPSEKKRLTKENIQKVMHLVEYLEMFYVGQWSLRHSDSRKLIRKIKAELEGEHKTDLIRRDVRLLRDQLFTIESV